MRIRDDFRKAVVFFGTADDAPGKGGIDCCGTGVLVHYDRFCYLVTAAHLARDLGEVPFLVRLNRDDGSAINLHGDGIVWYYHPEETVDIAIIPFNVTAISHQRYLPEKFLLIPDRMEEERIGIGDLTYTVGLFRLMSGANRNLPIVHCGNIALMPGDEKIPVRDWRDPSQTKTLHVNGYLVETHSLRGLSGSPVFVRGSVGLSGIPIPYAGSTTLTAQLPVAHLFLLGIWQSSWDAPPDQVMAAEVGRGVRVPVGLGVVVPAVRIREVLDLEEVRQHRDTHRRSRGTDAEQGAQPDSTRGG
jgi:hypothetical protein